jgi:hypothetical protein
VLGIEHLAERLRIAVTGWIRLRRAQERHVLAAEPEHLGDLGNDDGRNSRADPNVAREPLADLLEVDVQHHHDEKEEHHDSADVNED